MSGLERHAIPGNILDRVLDLERRLDDLELFSAIANVDPTGDGDITYVEILQEIALTAGADIAITEDAPDWTIARAGDSILLFDSGGDPVAEYAATEAGLNSALAAASSGQKLVFPLVPINITAAITIPTGISISGAVWNSTVSITIPQDTGVSGTFNFSGFSGYGFVMSTGSSVGGTVTHDGAGGYSQACAVYANGVQCSVSAGCYARNAATNIGAWLNGAGTGANRLNAERVAGNAQGGSENYGLVIKDYVLAQWATGEADGGTAVGVRLEISSLNSDSRLTYVYARAPTGTTCYGIQAASGSGNLIAGGTAYGADEGLKVEPGATCYAYNLASNSVENSGTLRGGWVHDDVGTHGEILDGKVRIYPEGDNAVVVRTTDSSNKFTRLLISPYSSAPAGGDTAIHLYHDRGAGAERFLGMGISHGVPEVLMASGDASGNDGWLPIRWISESGHGQVVNVYPMIQFYHDKTQALIDILGDAGVLRFDTDTPGGANEGVQYEDTGGNFRYALLFPGSNIVALCNQAADGTVQIRANTGTAGSANEVTVAEFEDDRIDLFEPPVLDASTLTISGDSVTATKPTHIIAAESGTADDLATISGGIQYQLLLIRADTGDTITVKHGTGNIQLNGTADFTLSGDKSLLLFYNGTNWSDAGAGGGGSATDEKVKVSSNDTTSDYLANKVTGTDGVQVSKINNGGYENLQASLDVSGLAEETDIDPVNDEAAVYDHSSSVHRKVPPQRFPSSSRMIYSQTADQEIVNTIVETTLLGDGAGSLTIPANSLIAGSVIRIYSRGQLSNTGTPSLEIEAQLGGTQICTSGAVALTSISAVEWQLEITITVRSVGATGEAVGGGLFNYDEGSEFDLGSGSGITIDFTNELDIDLLGTWGTADAANTILTRVSTVEILNPPPGIHTAEADTRVTTGGDTRVTTGADVRITATG